MESITPNAVWSMIFGISFMIIGGLVLWAYGARRNATAPISASGFEAEATKLFHAKLSRWFFAYGTLVVLIGIACLLFAASMISVKA